MISKVKPIPDGASVVIPRLVCRHPAAEIDFIVQTFEAKEQVRRPGPDGNIAHALLTIGTAMIMIEGEWPAITNRAPQLDGSSPVVLFVYVEDVDKTVERAVAAGAKILIPIADQFWGDRTAWVMDPSGHVWTIATRVEESTEEERQARLSRLLATPTKANERTYIADAARTARPESRDLQRIEMLQVPGRWVRWKARQRIIVASIAGVLTEFNIIAMLIAVRVSSMRRIALTLSLIFLLSCGNQQPSPKKEVGRADGTARMAAELATIYEQAVANPMPYFHLNRRRAELMRAQAQQLTGDEALIYRYQLARELLWAGQSQEAIQELQQIIQKIGQKQMIMAAGSKPLFDELAIAYLRLAEQENCIESHTGEACILPIVGAGVHTKQYATRQAIALYEYLLRRFRGDFGSQWLLNIAYMSIGAYPDSVPEPFLIEGLTPRPNSPVPRFPNIAVDLGVAVNGLSGGLNIEDFNGDGHLDLFMTSYGLNDPVHFFLADGQGGYVDHTIEAGLKGLVSGLNTVHADYDNDGDADILILRGAWLAEAGAHPNSLLRNNGDGTFEDVTHASGLLSYHPTQTAAWADFNLDGYLDLFIGNESNTQWQNVLAPAAVLGPFGLAFNDVATTFARLFGSALISFPILLWFARKSDKPELKKGVIYSQFAYFLVSIKLLVITQLTGLMNALGCSVVGIHAVFLVWLGRVLTAPNNL